MARGFPPYVTSPNNRPMGNGGGSARHSRTFNPLAAVQVTANASQLNEANTQVGFSASGRVVCARVCNASCARVSWIVSFSLLLVFVFASNFSECLFVAVLTNESYLDCRHSNVTNSLQPQARSLQPQARSLQPQARSHQPQPQASSCSTATSHVVWHQEKREAIMGVLCTQMIDVSSKAMFERTQTNELYSFCVQYSNVGGDKSGPTGTCKACSTKYSDRHAVLACAFPTTFAK